MTTRRNVLKGAASIVAAAGLSSPGGAETSRKKKVYYPGGKKPEKTPLFSSMISYGNLLFISGVGAHFPGDITSHTKHVLDEIENELKRAGSSMDKVLKSNVYLSDLKDYAGMNAVFQGRFGDDPPVRTTIAAAGLPGNSLVEIDVIAYI